MTTYTNEEILASIQQLLDKLPLLLPPLDAKALSAQLSEILMHLETPDLKVKNITLAFDAISQYEIAHDELKVTLIRSHGLQNETRLGMEFDLSPGLGSIVKPGEKAVCPVKPHYKITVHTRGQRCPQHNIELVPARVVNPQNSGNQGG